MSIPKAGSYLSRANCHDDDNAAALVTEYYRIPLRFYIPMLYFTKINFLHFLSLVNILLLNSTIPLTYTHTFIYDFIYNIYYFKLYIK